MPAPDPPRFAPDCPLCGRPPPCPCAAVAALPADAPARVAWRSLAGPARGREGATTKATAAAEVEARNRLYEGKAIHYLEPAEVAR
jgi:hypothetical protein